MFLLEYHQLKLSGRQEKAWSLNPRALGIGKLFNLRCLIPLVRVAMKPLERRGAERAVAIGGPTAAVGAELL